MEISNIDLKSTHISDDLITILPINRTVREKTFRISFILVIRVYLKHWFSNGGRGEFAPQRTFSNVWTHFWMSQN